MQSKLFKKKENLILNGDFYAYICFNYIQKLHRFLTLRNYEIKDERELKQMLGY